ncbi:cytochrome P450 [Streptomyces sp. NRRL B-24572]|uniref:cytochrome P450 n=1 Tax=Streptomyces sp. NRRL B-24572 TaxID=1962156 RepID=UPI0015C508BC|nr:cytochrome P450 [Streptomyces sp. NRRL B-24572]
MTPLIQDRTAALVLQGYGWLPDLRRRAPNGDVVRTRLLGRTAVALHGPEAVRFFYDEGHVRRAGALPGPVLDTLFGRGAVHTLDGADHRVRKALFVAGLTDPAAVASFVDHAETAWRMAFAPSGGREVVLFEEAALVLARAVRDWAGLPYDDGEVGGLARDCLAMVDGFATPGPRHLRARRARSRQEGVLARAVEEARGSTASAADTPFAAFVRHRDAGAGLLDLHTAAVELLNVARPAIAIAWFVAFSGHALHRWPGTREELRDDGSGAYATAFAHEVRRFYPFVPFVGGLAARDLEWRGEPIPEDALVLLDVYGQNHDAALWLDPYRFDPGRFLSRPPHPDALIPQGGGDVHAGHRCPGEDITVAVLAALSRALARQEWAVPPQDLRIPLRRIPTAPRSGLRIALPPV